MRNCCVRFQKARTTPRRKRVPGPAVHTLLHGADALRGVLLAHPNRRSAIQALIQVLVDATDAALLDLESHPAFRRDIADPGESVAQQTTGA